MKQNRNSDLSDHALKAFQYLEQVRFLQSQIEGLKEKLREKDMHSLAVQSPSDCSQDKVCTSLSEEAPFESVVVDKDLLEQQIAALTANLAPLKEQAVGIIKQHTTLIQQRVLLLHFIDGYSWSLVALMVSRQERHIYRIRKDALEQIILPDDAIWLE